MNKRALLEVLTKTNKGYTAQELDRVFPDDHISTIQTIIKRLMTYGAVKRVKEPNSKAFRYYITPYGMGKLKYYRKQRR